MRRMAVNKKQAQNRLPKRQTQKRDSLSTLLATEIVAYLWQVQNLRKRGGLIEQEDSYRCRMFSTVVKFSGKTAGSYRAPSGLSPSTDSADSCRSQRFAHTFKSFGSICRAASHEAHAATEATGTTCAAHAYALSKRKIIASVNRQRYAAATAEAAGAVGLAASWAPRLAKTWGTPNTAGLVRGDATRSSQLARLASDRFRRPAVSVVSRCHASRGFG